MSYLSDKGWGTKFPYDLIRVRVQANTSYQIKRIMETIGKEKGLVEMDRSEIMANSGEGPKLRMSLNLSIATIKRVVAKLQNNDIILRFGNNRKGEWRIK